LLLACDVGAFVEDAEPDEDVAGATVVAPPMEAEARVPSAVDETGDEADDAWRWTRG